MRPMATKQLITADEFMELSLDGPERYELIRGELRARGGGSEVSGPGWRHGVHVPTRWWPPPGTACR